MMHGLTARICYVIARSAGVKRVTANDFLPEFMREELRQKMGNSGSFFEIAQALRKAGVEIANGTSMNDVFRLYKDFVCQQERQSKQEVPT